jgi:hypothetical protein
MTTMTTAVSQTQPTRERSHSERERVTMGQITRGQWREEAWFPFSLVLDTKYLQCVYEAEKAHGRKSLIAS